MLHIEECYQVKHLTTSNKTKSPSEPHSQTHTLQFHITTNHTKQIIRNGMQMLHTERMSTSRASETSERDEASQKYHQISIQTLINFT